MDSVSQSTPARNRYEDLLEQMLAADDEKFVRKEKAALVESIMTMMPEPDEAAQIIDRIEVLEALGKQSTGLVLAKPVGVAAYSVPSAAVGAHVASEYVPRIRSATARIAENNMLASSHVAALAQPAYNAVAAPKEIAALPRAVQPLLLPRVSSATLTDIVQEKPAPVKRKFRAFERFQQKADYTVQRIATQAARLAAGFVFATTLMSSKPFETPVTAPLTVPAVTVTANKADMYEHHKQAFSEGVFSQYVVEQEPALTSTYGKRDLFEWHAKKVNIKGKTVVKPVKVKIQGNEYHRANDARSAVNDKNYALADGRITHIDRGSGINGAYIRVVTPDSLMYSIHHGQIPRDLSVGDSVHTGQVLSTVAPRSYSGVKPHTHVEVVALGGAYANMRGEHLNPFCMYKPAIRERIIANMEATPEDNLPSGFKYMDGETIREKLELACLRQATRLAYGADAPITVRTSSGKSYFTFTPDEMRPIRLAAVDIRVTQLASAAEYKPLPMPVQVNLQR